MNLFPLFQFLFVSVFIAFGLIVLATFPLFQFIIGTVLIAFVLVALANLLGAGA